MDPKIASPRFIAAAFTGALLALLTAQGAENKPAGQPNIVVILADDIGYGDIHCYDPKYAKVATPHVDRLAAEGMLFTDAHASASICTPSRYSLLTGRFSWRTPLQDQVLWFYGSPLISADRLTLPGMLRQQGYQTACIGKWHLGMDWPLRQANGEVARVPSGKFLRQRGGDPVFGEPINDGPTTRGFDTYFGVDTPNFPPYAFIENDRLIADPVDHNPGEDKNTSGYPGPMASCWRFDQTLPTLVGKAEEYLAQRAKDQKRFFLYLPLNSVHEPIAPSAPFVGKSGISPVADFIMETDAAVGRIVAALEKGGLAENTLLVFTADNGHSGWTDVKPFEKAGHRVSGPYRGGKGNISEGGHRVPMVIRWPGVVKPGARCEQLVCLGDLMATSADVLGVKLPDNAAEDSVSFLPLLRGGAAAVRQDLVLQCMTGRFLAIRSGDWKLITCAGNGYVNEHESALKRGLPPIQLYNVADDPAEARNLQARHPEIVQRLRAQLEKYISEGRSTTGPVQLNDIKLERLSWSKDKTDTAGR
jgi:arylsulfatase A